MDLSQRYNLKANHNTSIGLLFSSIVVGFKPKIQFESKSQLKLIRQHKSLVVGFKPKIQFESKSQPGNELPFHQFVVGFKPKIQFESKSQH